MKKTIVIAVVLIVIVVGVFYVKKKMTSSVTAPTPTASKESTLAPADNIYLIKTDATKGSYITDFQGMTLYTFDKDKVGVSNCEGACLKAWPAYSSGATAQKTFPANISVITRSDGSKQFAWKGMPLYYYANDAKAGDITGDGVNGVWYIVKP